MAINYSYCVSLNTLSFNIYKMRVKYTIRQMALISIITQGSWIGEGVMIWGNKNPIQLVADFSREDWIE